MTILNSVALDLDDLLIVPAATSGIKSRSEVDVCDGQGMLPLFTAPMDTVIDDHNIDIFAKHRIYAIQPRNICQDIIDPGKWVALSLNQFEQFVESQEKIHTPCKILVDIANGHMQKLYNLVIEAKEKFGDMLILMVGNVANPVTYQYLSEAGADYVRISIGSGSGCLTSQQVGVGYPLATLIDECRKVNIRRGFDGEKIGKKAKIVADGGMRSYADVIKALALGADYVMLGSVFNKALESAGDTFKANIRHEGWLEPGIQVDQYSADTRQSFINGAKFFKKFRGMSTKEVQKSLGNNCIRTSEGVTRMNPVEYTLEGWVENFRHYLASAMSYAGAKNLQEFRTNTKLIQISQAAHNRFAK